LPIAQLVHSSIPVEAANLPGVQSKQALACLFFEYLPVAHFSQDAVLELEAPEVEIVPSGHFEHLGVPPESPTENWPSAQLVQLVLPLVGWCLPASQDLQTDVPA
jgi:hypothetical protein